MSTQTDAARERARSHTTGQFGEQHLTDPGSSVLAGPTRDHAAGRLNLHPVEPFVPPTPRPPLLRFQARRDVKARLVIDQQVLGERKQILTSRTAAMEDARMVMLANDSRDGGLSRALFEQAVDRVTLAEHAVASAQRIVDEAEWRLSPRSAVFR